MQATISDKIYFHTAVILLYACLVVLIWCVSPISFLKPDTTVHAAPAVHVVKKPIKKVLSGKPVQIVLPSVGIDLPVADGNYDAATGTWTIGNHQAYYATPTPLINDDSGTTLIYGHNNRTAFRNLRNITPAAELVVYTDNGYVFHYEYVYATELQPTDTSLLTYEGAPTVTLQTCSGNWNEFRKMFIFDLKSIDKPPSHV